MPTLKLMTRAFARFARRERTPGSALAEAAARIDEGSIDADLGGGLFKQRVARPGQGRSGGWRTIIVYRAGDRAVFVHGFAKRQEQSLAKGIGGIEAIGRRDLGDEARRRSRHDC